MAGDWMKIELGLPDKPEVHRIAGILSIDSDAVVGKLVRVWEWFNKHTVDGNGHGVTFLLLDRISGVTGFGEAMCLSGWMEQGDGFISMPKFDRHTSESSKARALASKRTQKSKAKSNGDGNSKGNAPAVTRPLPREEKRREVNTSRFSEFWISYPRKEGKAKAEQAFTKANINGEFDSVMTALKKQAASCQDFQFFPHASTWLNGKRWEDQADPAPADASLGVFV